MTLLTLFSTPNARGRLINVLRRPRISLVIALVLVASSVTTSSCTFGNEQHVTGEGEGEVIGEGEGAGEGEGSAITISYAFENADGSVIANDTLDLGQHDIAAGFVDVDLLLKNTGATDFQIVSDPPLLVAGTDASLFAVTAQPADVVHAGEAVPFSIQYAPQSPGANEGKLLFAYGVDERERVVLTVDATATGQVQQGLHDAIYDGAFTSLPDFSGLSPTSTGTTTGFDISARAATEHFAYVFTGFVRADVDGDYTFFLTSDDGSRMFIDGTKLVDDDGDHGAQEASGTATLTAGSHAIEVDYYNDTGAATLVVEWLGPTFAREPIPDDHLFLAGP